MLLDDTEALPSPVVFGLGFGIKSWGLFRILI